MRSSSGIVSLAVVLTLATQTLASMALIAPAVLAPAAAADIGIAPERIGLFVAINYIVAMSVGLAGGAAIARWGGIGVCQISLAAITVGLSLGSLGTTLWIALGACAIGMGYGLINPATAHILARIAPPSMLALILSIKQTGVPMGGLIAGLTVPTLALAFGWRTTLYLIAAIGVVLVAVCEVGRRRIDGQLVEAASQVTVPLGWSAVTTPLKLVWGNRILRDTAFVSMAYSIAQTATLTYIVAYANLELGHSLVTSGVILAVLSVCGIGGRIVWGAVADRLARPRLLLGALGVANSILLVGLTLVAPLLSFSGLLVWCAAVGVTVLGWNGVSTAETVRAAPPGQVGTASGGSQFFTFFGALAGPAVAGLIVSATGRYSVALAILGLAPIAIAWRLFVPTR
ncbi:MAG: MFS transporter [Burkholderiales bacterium]